MWKLVSTFRILRFMPLPANIISIGKRTFLSEAFKCEDAWQKRLQAPILQNLNLDELFRVLDQKFNRDGKASAIDIDLFANAVRDESYVDELEDVIHKLRLSPNTTNTLSSTSHAVIRYYVDIERYDTLIRILDDRMNFGVFSDNYCLALLLDTFIKKNKITEAARLSSIQMLQEDWSCPLATSLALYACHLYVQNPDPWPVEVEDDTGEVVKVRVPYIRNPYFDDHFDLRDPQLLIGKTLAAIGATIPDAVGQTYRLVGLGLFKKWEKAISHLQQLPKSGIKPGIFESGLKIFKENYEKELSDENDPEGKHRENLRKSLKELDNQGLITNDDLHAAVVSKVEQIVAKEQQNVINAQSTIYQEWENDRDRLLKEQIEELRRQQRLAAVEQEKQRLGEKEQELFFFDNEEKIDLLLEKQELLQTEVEKEMEQMSKGKKKKKEDDLDYIPPEVRSLKT